MKFYVEGEKSRAICSCCEGIVETTFARRDVPFSDGQGEAKDILVSVCDKCGAIVGIPAQSTPSIKAAREAAVVPIEARLPALYIELLDHAMQAITSAAATRHRKIFLSYYIDYLARRKRSSQDAFTWERSKNISAKLEVKESTYNKRLSLKLNSYIAKELDSLKGERSVSQTDVLKDVIFQMQNDVVEHPNPELIKELTTLARVAV